MYFLRIYILLFTIAPEAINECHLGIIINEKCAQISVKKNIVYKIKFFEPYHDNRLLSEYEIFPDQLCPFE